MAQGSFSVDTHFEKSPDQSAKDFVELARLIIVDKNTY
jgi:hypothetical protein